VRGVCVHRRHAPAQHAQIASMSCIPATRAESSSIKAMKKTKKGACSHRISICDHSPVFSVHGEFLIAAEFLIADNCHQSEVGPRT
jgi:hypothetical protein